ncbi:hypothetical protein HY78_22630 [Rhizorhabdus wittichii DC-6]|uniref:DoxX family protein n=1 Tax=Rhizorhabdus wittichii TaxID=160791 RepID=A0A975D5A8_9SPHN|nr:DoxX family protein [Rhizorhabdus wittichii]ARR56046.1 hypothetical protein HY78_22630 [Rhizorhabdus wittichii DC-6]QTH23181.1 DoxX family protein [Rhizorhabdus wittichii]
MPFPTDSVQAVLGYAVAFVMATGVAVNLAGPAGIRAAYARWGYPAGFRFVTALLEALSAILIPIEATRPWGLMLAAAIMLAAIATLVRAREHLHALPAIAIGLAAVAALA